MLKHINFDFNGQSLEILEVDGQPMLDAGHLSEVLGYERRNRLSDLIRGKWAHEFEDERDYRFVPTSRLTANGGQPKNSPPRLLLTEPGWNLVFIKTRKPLGVALRRFLAEEVIPQLTRTGQYVPGGLTHDDAVVTRVARAEERLDRLESTVDRIEAKQDVLGDTMKQLGAVMAQLVDKVSAIGTAPAVALPGPAQPTPLVGISITPPAIPEGFTVRGLSSLARAEGITVPKLKARLQAANLMADSHWAWKGKDPVVTGSGTVRQDTIYRFRPGILTELRRREDPSVGQGPLFNRGQGEQ